MTFFKGSRYSETESFEPDPEGRSGFAGVRQRPVGPAAGVLEHTVEMGDRLDTLGFNYFAESRLWYRIGEANLDVLFPEDLIWEPAEEDFSNSDPSEENGRERLGAQILIPRAKEV